MTDPTALQEMPLVEEGAIDDSQTPEDAVPDWPPLGTNQVSALPEGSTVIAMSGSEQRAQKFIVHRESGRIYARSESDVAGGAFDRQKVLTFMTRVWLPKP
jgi:hypothetical protein